MPTDPRSYIPIPRKRVRRRLARRAGLASLLGIALGLGLLSAAQWSLAGVDARLLTRFIHEVDTEWFAEGVDFRDLTLLYAERASETADIRPFGHSIVATMAYLRSHPLVVQQMPEFEWDEGSADHYITFQRGPLHSYLLRGRELAGHLYVDQRDAILRPLAERGWEAESPAGSDLVDTLPPRIRNEHLEESVAAQLEDLYHELAPKPGALDIRAKDLARTDFFAVNRGMEQQASQLAVELGLNPDLDRLTDEEQARVLAALDGHIHRHDPLLWRQKQLNDFIGGVVGVPEATSHYVNLCARPFILIRATLQWTGIVLVVLFSMVLAHRLLTRGSMMSWTLLGPAGPASLLANTPRRAPAWW